MPTSMPLTLGWLWKVSRLSRAQVHFATINEYFGPDATHFRQCHHHHHHHHHRHLDAGHLLRLADVYFSATNQPLSKDAADQRAREAGQLPNLWITVAIIVLIIVLILPPHPCSHPHTRPRSNITLRIWVGITSPTHTHT